MWQKFWTLFGASNQLLAALTLLSITVWLHQARKPHRLHPLPHDLRPDDHPLGARQADLGEPPGDATASTSSCSTASRPRLLILLALYLAFSALVKLRGERGAGAVPVEV